MEIAGKGVAIYWKKPNRDWLKKHQLESVIGAQSLICTRILFCRQWAGLDVLIKVTTRADIWKIERSWERIENLLSS